MFSIWTTAAASGTEPRNTGDHRCTSSPRGASGTAYLWLEYYDAQRRMDRRFPHAICGIRAKNAILEILAVCLAGGRTLEHEEA